MKTIALSKGFSTIVDDEDFDFLNQFKWSYHHSGYAVRMEVVKGFKRKTLLMHRVINKTPEGLFTDHVNGNGLDNRKCNLRNATPTQNQRNKSICKNNTSGFKGVSWHKNRNKWSCTIRIGVKKIYLGYFNTKEDAAEAYNLAAEKYHGEFRRK